MNPPILWRLRMWLISKLSGYGYLDKWLKSLSPDPNFFFVQVGANDGLRNDPIHPYVKQYGWQGILIEPQTKAYHMLQQNYQGCQGLVFENIAIGTQDGQLELFTIDATESEEWHDLIATARPEVGLLKDQNRKVVSQKVQALTLETLWQRHGVNNIDLMLMDLEGFEPKIFQSYSWSLKPKKIYFETRHLGYMQFQEVQKILHRQGYRLFTERGDCLAWLS